MLGLWSFHRTMVAFEVGLIARLDRARPCRPYKTGLTLGLYPESKREPLKILFSGVTGRIELNSSLSPKKLNPDLPSPLQASKPLIPPPCSSSAAPTYISLFLPIPRILASFTFVCLCSVSPTGLSSQRKGPTSQTSLDCSTPRSPLTQIAVH